MCVSAPRPTEHNPFEEAFRAALEAQAAAPAPAPVAPRPTEHNPFEAPAPAPESPDRPRTPLVRRDTGSHYWQ